MNIKKQELTSASHSDFTLEALRQIAPSAFTEVRDEQGELTHKIDFDVLRELLGDKILDSDEERFGFYWVGKQDAKRAAAEPTRKTLRPVLEDSVDWDTTQNLYIEGDNLEVLKLLQRAYLGKVKMIYIDPPYNTGNDFVYDDDFAMSREDMDDAMGNLDEDGNRLRRNLDSNPRYHSDWCSMIYSRLLVARTLLANDGVIFISIDDNEVHHLRKICDEVFGASNFVAEFIWRGGRRNAAKFISTSHEYMLCYASDLSYCNDLGLSWHERKIGLTEIYKEVAKLQEIDTSIGFKPEASLKLKQWYRELAENHPSKNHSHYSCIDERGVYFPSDISRGGGGGPKWTIINPHTGNPVQTPTRGWAYSKLSDLESDVAAGLIHFNGDGVPCKKRYLKDNETQLKETVFYRDRRGASKRLRSLLGGDVFTFPKDEGVIKEFISTFASPDSLILDFFSGSATTAHAVMQLNAEDGGKRKYICVQLPEETPEGSEARKAGYDTICEIGKERIRRAGEQIVERIDGTLANRYQEMYNLCGGAIESPNPSAMSYFLQGASEEQVMKYQEASSAFDEIKKRKDSLDTGFRVLRVDTSNMEEVYFEPAALRQDQLFGQVDSVKEDRSDLDLLFGCMVDWGVELSYPLRQEEVAGKHLYIVNEGALVACFEEDIDLEVIRAIAKLEPLRVLFRESCFASDADKLNIYEQFKQFCGWSAEEAYRRIHVI